MPPRGCDEEDEFGAAAFGAIGSGTGVLRMECTDEAGCGTTRRGEAGDVKSSRGIGGGRDWCAAAMPEPEQEEEEHELPEEVATGDTMSCRPPPTNAGRGVSTAPSTPSEERGPNAGEAGRVAAAARLCPAESARQVAAPPVRSRALDGVRLEGAPAIGWCALSSEAITILRGHTSGTGSALQSGHARRIPTIE